MEEINSMYIIGALVSGLLALIGILYRNSTTNTRENAKEIKRLDDETDGRLDGVENRLTKVETKLEK